jgi:hypothetical protein
LYNLFHQKSTSFKRTKVKMKITSEKLSKFRWPKSTCQILQVKKWHHFRRWQVAKKPPQNIVLAKHTHSTQHKTQVKSSFINHQKLKFS